MDDDRVKCPTCGSEQVHAEKRGWTLQTGVIGSDKIVITCLKCGHKFEPGKTTVTSPMTTAVWVVLGLIGLLFLISLLSE